MVERSVVEEVVDLSVQTEDGGLSATVGVVSPMGLDDLVIEIATTTLLRELKRRLPLFPIRLFAPGADVARRVWPDVVPVEDLTEHSSMDAGALVVMDTDAVSAPEFDMIFGSQADAEESEVFDGFIRLPLPAASDEVTLDLSALIDLSGRMQDPIEWDELVEGLRRREMWGDDGVVLVDTRGDDRPKWWWSVLAERAAAVGAVIVTCSFDASTDVLTADGHLHLDGAVGPSTILASLSASVGIITDDPLLDRLARSLGTPVGPATADDAEQLHRSVVERWSDEVGVDSARLLAIDLAIDRLAEVAAATTALRAQLSYAELVQRTARRAEALEIAHHRLLARLAQVRSIAGRERSDLEDELAATREALALANARSAGLASLLERTHAAVREAQISEPLSDTPRSLRRRWRRAPRALIRRILPARVRGLGLRALRRVRRGR